MTPRIAPLSTTEAVDHGTIVPKNLRGRPFAKGHDPRRGISPGRPSDEFIAGMRALASSGEVLASLRSILTDRDHPHFMKAFTYCADRGYGKATQPVELTPPGESIADILRKGRDRVARMRNAE